MSRSGNFRGDNRQTDRQTDYFTPAHARGVKKEKNSQQLSVFSLGKMEGLSDGNARAKFLATPPLGLLNR